jgi:MFS family permease
MADRRRFDGFEPWQLTALLLSIGTSGVAPMLIPLEVVRIEGRALHVGAVMAAVGAGMISAPLWGALAHRTRAYRATIVVGALVIAASLAGFCVTREWHEWVALAVVMGAGIGAVFTSFSLLIAERLAGPVQDAAVGWLQTLSTIGTVIGLLLAGAITHWSLGEEVGFAIAAGLSVAGAALAGAKLPRPGKTTAAADAAPAAGPAGDLAPQPAAGTTAGATRATVASFCLLLAAWTASMLGVNAVSALYPLLMHQEFAVPPSVSSYLLAAITFLSLGLFLPSSRLTAARGGLTVLQGALLVRGAALGLLAVLATRPESSLPVLALLAYAAFGLVWPLLSVSSTILVTRLGGAVRGSGPGLANASAAAAGLAGPVVGGHVADSFGYQAVWALGAIGVAAGFVFTLPLMAVAAARRRGGAAAAADGAPAG